MSHYSPLELRYKRVVLKLSGEALAGKQGSGIDYDVVLEICKNIKTAVQSLGVQMGIVVGGGNFWRGRTSGKMDRTRAVTWVCLPQSSMRWPWQMLLNR